MWQDAGSAGAEGKAFPKDMFNIEYDLIEGGLIYLRRRQVIFSKNRCFFGNVLDAGCGKGLYASEIMKRGATNYTGIDLNSELLLESKKLRGHNINLSIGNLEELPFKSNAIDFILCSEVIEHLNNPTRAFDEMFRVMKEGGTLLLSVPTQPLPKSLFLLFKKKFGGLSVKYFMSEDHLREYCRFDIGRIFKSLSMLKKDLINAGFRVISNTPAWVIGSPLLTLLMRPVIFRPLNHVTTTKILVYFDALLSMFLPNFGTHAIIVCKKH